MIICQQIDLPKADVQSTLEQMKSAFGFEKDKVLQVLLNGWIVIEWIHILLGVC